MAPSHNVVLLVDTAEPDAKGRVRLVCLRLLNFLTCRAGLGQVRWSYRFLNSQGGRCRPPRRSDLRELAPRSWDEFEEDLEACWERARQSRACQQSSSRAGLTHTALMETLADFQWDRPDISSPTKPTILKARKGKKCLARDEALKAESPSSCPVGWGCGNAVFLVSPCPHTASQLGIFSGSSGLQHVTDRLLPRSLQTLLSDKRVTLYWLDTTDWAQVWNLSEHSGYWTMVELMKLVGGRVLPSEVLLSSTQHFSSSWFGAADSIQIPCDSVLNYMICNESEYRLLFPLENAVLFSPPGVADLWECPVTLEPISVNQKPFKRSTTIKLKGIVQHWSLNQTHSVNVESWILQNSSKDGKSCHLSQLLHTLLSRRLHMSADIFTEEELYPITGVLTPLSESAAILIMMCNNEACELSKLFLCDTVHEPSEDVSADLSDIVSSILTNISTTFIEDVCVSDHTLPEWINRELAQNDQWSSSVVEKWHSLSGSSGVSSFLMDSFRLIHAGSPEDDQSDSFKCHQEITQSLSEYYQMKSSEDPGIATAGEKSKRLPCTPVRQKMKSMPRALQMLNTARLNVKAQKSQPDNLSALPNDKKNRQVKKRSSNKTEERLKALKHKGFKSEEELYTHLYDDYEKTVSGKDDSLITCARNSIATIKYYMKSYHNECDEMDCVHKIKKLLKTSKSIRQFYGDNQKKETKLRECQIQVFLRLEMCAQCPLIQTNTDHTDELEQIIEEITDMLRIICLTEDPLFLTKFLEENVLTEYIAVLPKILGEIYYGLGRQIPENLALMLPACSDDSVTQDSISTVPSQQPVSRVPSVSQLVTESEQLEELRTRSAKKRRTSTVARHRSLAESSQIMRQIEIPRKQLNKFWIIRGVLGTRKYIFSENLLSNPVVMIEKLKYPLPTQQKDIEATKARRNLFENQTPTKKCHKLPRSQSVSAVEGLKRKRCISNDGTKEYKLLTRNVSETPLRKQTSNRLLYKQIKGRRSESTSNISIVEESPEKEIKEIDLRRSPRIKQLAIARRNSFYASRPKSRNLERVDSFTKQIDYSGNSTNTEVKSPKHILFGEVLKVCSPPAAKRRLSDVESNSKARGKTKMNMPAKVFEDVPERNRMPQKSPRTPKTPTRMSGRLKTPSKSSSERKKAARNLGKLFSPSKLREPMESVSPTKESSPNKLISPVTKTREQTIARLDEIPQPLGFVMTPTRYSSINRTSQQDSSNTPTKSPYKLLESGVGSTPQKYEFRTPQKPMKPPVSKTSVAKYEEESGLHLFQRANECTPEKHFSTVKHTAMAWATSSNHTPNRRFSNSSSVKASGLENISALLGYHCTPKKSLLENSHHSHSVQFTSPEPTSKARDVQENPAVYAYQSTSEFAMDSCQMSAPGQTSPTAAPLPREILLSPCSKHALPSKLCSPKCRVEPIVLCEKLNLSSFESALNSESFIGSSQTEESIDVADAMVLPMEPTELKLNALVTQKPSDCGLKTDLPMVCRENSLSSSPYCLRCTPDRRQREAAARLQPQQIPTQFSTPKSRQSLFPSDIPTYEVALEMQPSGLPKLRFKRTDSNSTVDPETGNKIESPHAPKKKKGDESPFSEKWCNKHTNKPDTTCLSPCLRTCHATPGKCSFQTLICQSYTPNRGTSNTTSPSHIDGVPWTPSPKFKDRNGSDAINNWPRKKKASALNGGLKGDKIQEYSDLPSAGEDTGVTASQQEANNKSLEDFELEGVSKLQEKSPVLQLQGTCDIETSSHTSRKRSIDFLSPTKDPQHSKRSRIVSRRHKTINQGNEFKGRTEMNSPYRSLSSNLSSSQQSSCDDEVFSDPGCSPPNKVVNTLSTSGLLTLTRSPLLYIGKTPSSKRNMQGVESEHSTPTLQRQTRQTSDSDDSPFSKGAPVRTSNRTYSRKRLIP